MSIRLSLSALSLSIALVATPGPASAFCGFYVSGAGDEIFNDATQVVMMRFGTLTVLSMQNAYKGPPEDFAMVVPVPVVLQEDNVKTLEDAVFATVDKLAAPRLVEYWEQNPCPATMADPGSGAPPMPSSAPREESEAADDGEALGVKVEAEFTVGEYEVVILSAEESTGLDTWLRQENYQIPDGAEPYLRPYVQGGSKFFVARVDVSKVKFQDGRALLSPLRFHYDSETFSLPVRLGMMNSSGTQDLIVHILAPNQRYEVANYENVTIPTNLVVEEGVKESFGAFYNALFDYTVAQNPGAVVTEYAWPSWPGKCDPCPGAVQGIDQNTLQLLGGDLIGEMLSDVDLVALQEELQEAQRAYNQNPQDTALRQRYQEINQRYWRANSRVQQMMSSFVLTRLHARYGKDEIGDDLVFRAAPPIIGGRGMPNEKGELEERTQPASINQFQGRYVILHRWEGDVSCADPRFGRWGGPPGGGMQMATSPPRSAELAVAERGPVNLQELVGGELPDFEYTSSATGAGTGTTVSMPPRQRSERGCGCEAASGGPLGALVLMLGWLMIRRRRPSRPARR